MVDSTPPTIRSFSLSPSTQIAGGFVVITANVTDDMSVASVTAHVVGPSFDANLTMVSGGGTIWYANQTYLTPGSYSVTVWAVDGTGNSVSRTGSFSISPAPVPVPTGVFAHVLADGTIHVTWSPITGGTIAGYNVYRSMSAGGPFTKLTSTPLPATGPLFYIDRDVQPGVTYYYVVTAVDLGGNESPQSLATSARVPGTAPTTAADPTLWIITAGALAVAIAASVVVWRRRKKAP
jgi:LPXTG-motif cell wall-anchored protein